MMPREYWQSSFSSARHTISRSVNPGLALHLKFHFQYAMCFMEFVLGQASLCHKLKAWSQEKSKNSLSVRLFLAFLFSGVLEEGGGQMKTLTQCPSFLLPPHLSKIRCSRNTTQSKSDHFRPSPLFP